MMAFCQLIYMMMCRTKTKHIPLISGQSNIKEAECQDKTWLINLCTLCGVSSFAIQAVCRTLNSELNISTIFLSLFVAATWAILTGYCSIEFLTSRAQAYRSVYSCFYQTTCEILAYFVGWSWILSLIASTAIISRVISSHIDCLLDHQITNVMNTLMPSLCPDLLSVFILATVMMLSLMGLSQAPWWYFLLMPMSFLLTTTSVILTYMSSSEPSTSFRQLGNPQDVLTGCSICSLGFLTFQSALRLPPNQIRRKHGHILSLLNVLCLIFTFLATFLLSRSEQLKDPYKTTTLTMEILALFFIDVELYYLTMTIVQEMAADGLIIRCLSKKWRPFCYNVPILATYLLTTVLMAVLSTALSSVIILKVAAFGPLFIVSGVSITTLLERYQDRNSWLYEPVLQNGLRKKSKRHRSKKQIIESLSRVSEAIELQRIQLKERFGSDTDSNTSSTTDIDSVVQEYKDHVQLSKVDLSCPASEVLIQEPTPATSLKAKWLVLAHLANSVLLAATLTFGTRLVNYEMAIFVSVIILGTVMSVIFLCLLHRLPQNRGNKRGCDTAVYAAPYLPGLSATFSVILCLHVATDIWFIILIWTITGAMFYFMYGIRNSTAASSFYGLSIPAEVKPLPFPGDTTDCLKYVVLPQKPQKKIMSQV